jgi:hypothetical protein
MPTHSVFDLGKRVAVVTGGIGRGIGGFYKRGCQGNGVHLSPALQIPAEAPPVRSGQTFR